MEMKNDRKLEKKLTCDLENDKRSQIFTWALKSLKIGTLMRSFYTK